MVLEKLEELEYVEGSFAHSKVEETSEFKSEWDRDVNVSKKFGSIIIVLKNRTGFLHDWESVAELERGENEVEYNQNIENSQVNILLEVHASVEILCFLLAFR